MPWASTISQSLGLGQGESTDGHTHQNSCPPQEDGLRKEGAVPSPSKRNLCSTPAGHRGGKEGPEGSSNAFLQIALPPDEARKKGLPSQHQQMFIFIRHASSHNIEHSYPSVLLTYSGLPVTLDTKEPGK